MNLNRSLWEDLVEILVKSCLRGPSMILYRSLSEGLVEILERSFLRGPCMKILQMPCLRGACMNALPGCSWEVLASRSSPPPTGPFMTILWDSLRGPGMQILVKVFYISLWEDLVEILVKSAEKWTLLGLFGCVPSLRNGWRNKLQRKTSITNEQQCFLHKNRNFLLKY